MTLSGVLKSPVCPITLENKMKSVVRAYKNRERGKQEWRRVLYWSVRRPVRRYLYSINNYVKNRTFVTLCLQGYVQGKVCLLGVGLTPPPLHLSPLKERARQLQWLGLSPLKERARKLQWLRESGQFLLASRFCRQLKRQKMLSKQDGRRRG